MSAKALDRKGIYRARTVSFKASEEEIEMLHRKVALSGMTKQDYIINCILDKEIVIEPSPFVIRSLKRELLKQMDENDDIEMATWVKDMIKAFNGNKKTKVKPIGGPRQ